MSEYSELLVARQDHFHEVVIALAAFDRDNGKTFRKRNKLLGLVEIIYLLCFEAFDAVNSLLFQFAQCKGGINVDNSQAQSVKLVIHYRGTKQYVHAVGQCSNAAAKEFLVYSLEITIPNNCSHLSNNHFVLFFYQVGKSM